MIKEKRSLFSFRGKFPRLFYFRRMQNNKTQIKKLALAALFAAAAFAVSLLEIPVFPQIGLKLDFSFAVMLIGGYILGVFYGEMIIIATMLLNLIKTQSLGIGELANFIMANCFITIPVFVYKFRKGLKAVIVTLALSSLLQIGVALLCNRFIFYPLYENFLQMTAKEAFMKSWYLIIAFNALKCFLNALITVLLYKKLKKVLNKYFD